MNDTLLLLLFSLGAMAFGAFLGKIIFGLNAQGKLVQAREKGYQLQLQIDDLKEQLFRSLEDRKTALQEQREQAKLQLEKTEKEREEIRREKDFLSTELARRNSEFENLQLKNKEHKAEVEELQEKFSKEFENLANRILEQKSAKFTNLNRENIQNILHPLQEKIKTFEEKVEKNSNDFIDRHARLDRQLQFLNEQNLKISEEANNLTKALKGENKTQGNWGELILERVLEKSGLEKNREYFVQHTCETDEGKKAVPDVVLYLPGDKRMIIDSKVSLTAYERYVNEEDQNRKRHFLKEHLKSLNKHITDLSAKKYEDLYKIKSPDFVLMFIPVEPALYLAQNIENSFFYTAFQKNILLVSPTTLLSVLRTIDTIWSNEKQQQNALEIAGHATSLYHKFKLLLDELETLGSRLNSTSAAYNSAMKKLTGKQNLIKDINKLEELGVSPKQKISQKWLNKAETDEPEDPLLN